MLTRAGLLRGEVWRLATYAFLTMDWMELLFKILILFYIAIPLEATWGTRRFLTVFGISVVAGGLTAAALGVELAGGWAATMTLMLIHGFLFPENRLLLLFVIPIRVKTLAIFLTAFFLVGCVAQGLRGLAPFAGLFSGVLYYVFITRSIPWMRKGARKVAAGALNPASIAKNISAARVMERARRIMRERAGGGSLADEDRAFIEELIQRTDPTHELCSPYSFSPDNEICPPCREFGRCLRRYLEAEDEKPEEATS